VRAWRLAVGVLVIVLALGPALPAHAGAPLHLWVDEDYCSTCSNGAHVWNVDAFSTISAALRAAAPGATVHVAPGSYYEDVRIAQPVRLLATGPGVILSPRRAQVTVAVAANGVTVDGLEVAGGSQAAILVTGPDFQREPIRDVTIRGCTVRGGLFGIAVNIDLAWNYGTLPAEMVEISDNTVSGCTRAIYVYNAEAEITRNDVSQLAPEGIGIYSSQGSVSHIVANTVRADAPHNRAIYILDNQGTVVDRNSLVGTADVLTPTTAITLDGYDDLVLSNNRVDGFYWGTHAYTGGTARVERNSFHNTAAWAISFGTAITTTQVTIADNLISGSYWGLRLDDDSGYGLQAAVYGNSFSNNVIGVQLASSVTGDEVALHGNAFCGNLSAGLRSEAEAPIDARENWWGANSGPGPAGSGDQVKGVGTISVSPWVRLSASATSAGEGRTRIVATLASDHYRLGDYPLVFSTTQGTFISSADTTCSVPTEADGTAQVTLTLAQGQGATVYVGSSCGPVLSLSVPQGAQGPSLPLLRSKSMPQ